MVTILTRKERNIIEKKISGRKLSQIERNRLSRAIRPKLREISQIDSKKILEKIDYNPKSISVENKIISIIKDNIKKLDSIILYGSAVQTNYHEYNDIDIIIVTKEKISPEYQKYKKIKEIKDIMKANSIISDIEIISRDNLLKSYKNSPTLIYELKDRKVIYGKIKIPDKIELYNIDLHNKLDWSKIEDIEPNGRDIYNALKNTILVRLLLNKIIDNSKLKQSMYDGLGKNLIEKLRTNNQSREEKKYALNYLKKLIEETRKQIRGDLWEKIEL